jgi:hypothetical protein
VLTLLALGAPLSARPTSPTLLYEVPTADVLPSGALAISADMTYPLVNTPKNVNYLEVNANVRYSPLEHLDFAVTAYTFADYALDVKYQMLGGDPDRFGLAVGVYDIGLHEYVSPVGHDTANAWPDWKYNKYLPRYDRPTERFSAFAVTSIPVTKFARLHLGLGRGRFVGYDDRSKFLNIDYFFDEYHQWAFGLFGGAEVFLTPQVALVAEASSRDLNTGVKVNFRAFTGTVAWTKMEGLLFDEGDARFGRLEVGVTWQFTNLSGLAAIPRLFQRPARVPPMEPIPPPPEPVPIPALPGPPPSPMELELEPIWFEWDKWDITPAAESALHRNADKLLAHPDVRIVITGHASEEGTLEHNLPLSARRANAAYEDLKSLGVPGQQMRFRALGESPGRPLPPNRVVYFEIEPEQP